MMQDSNGNKLSIGDVVIYDGEHWVIEELNEELGLVVLDSLDYNQWTDTLPENVKKSTQSNGAG